MSETGRGPSFEFSANDVASIIQCNCFYLDNWRLLHSENNFGWCFSATVSKQNAYSAEPEACKLEASFLKVSVRPEVDPRRFPVLCMVIKTKAKRMVREQNADVCRCESQVSTEEASTFCTLRVQSVTPFHTVWLPCRRLQLASPRLAFIVETSWLTDRSSLEWLRLARVPHRRSQRCGKPWLRPEWRWKTKGLCCWMTVMSPACTCWLIDVGSPVVIRWNFLSFDADKSSRDKKTGSIMIWAWLYGEELGSEWNLCDVHLGTGRCVGGRQ